LGASTAELGAGAAVAETVGEVDGSASAGATTPGNTDKEIIAAEASTRITRQLRVTSRAPFVIAPEGFAHRSEDDHTIGAQDVAGNTSQPIGTNLPASLQVLTISAGADPLHVHHVGSIAPEVNAVEFGWVGITFTRYL
jgi:hypothetical protein